MGRQHKARQGKARQGEAGKARQARQGEARQGKAKQGKKTTSMLEIHWKICIKGTRYDTCGTTLSRNIRPDWVSLTLHSHAQTVPTFSDTVIQ